MECSGTHRSYGVNLSYVRSATLNTLTNQQLKTLEIGGNKRLREFLKLHKTPSYLGKKQLFNTNLMHYYRRLVIYILIQLKNEVNKDQIDIELPDRRDLFESFNLNKQYYKY
jgi:hypothetical protein